MVMKIYVHADLDAFFASAEVLKTPSLRGRAFVVGSESYRERYRGVALTATYEARVYGIRSGMSIAECYRRCPTLLYREPDHPLYRRLSERVMTILSGFTNNLIQTSVDEAYMVFDGEVEDVIRTCREMKSFVKEKTGLTMSVGGGATPIIAKIASSLSKPNGL
ncbi:MAG: DNA polymerase IV, partial [Thermoplasmata archaeon]|nr:DNA polymerase IV [Thermoplasmata archaeon]